MAKTQRLARMHGIPRKKRAPKPNLKEDVKRKNHILLIEASIGIIGMAGSGRKTLAYRFDNMGRGDFQDGEVPVAYFYTATFGEDFPPWMDEIPYKRCRMRLTSYIIDPPMELPIRDPPLYSIHWNNFCCLVLVFDVVNQASFLEASSRLTSYRRENYRIPRVCILVGNKSDRRYEILPQPGDPEYLNQRPVFERTAVMEAHHLNALYLECSAKINTKVWVVLFFVKYAALDRINWSQYP